MKNLKLLSFLIGILLLLVTTIAVASNTDKDRLPDREVAAILVQTGRCYEIDSVKRKIILWNLYSNERLDLYYRDPLESANMSHVTSAELFSQIDNKLTDVITGTARRSTTYNISEKDDRRKTKQDWWMNPMPSSPRSMICRVNNTPQSPISPSETFDEDFPEID